MNRILIVFALMVSVSFYSCKSDDVDTDTNTEEEESTPSVSEASKSEGETIKEDEDAKSEKVKGEQTVNGESVESPSTVNAELSDEALAELELLTGQTDAAKIAGVTPKVIGAGWFLNTVDGEKKAPEESHIYFFSSVGYYFQLDVANKDWSWGYYYIDTMLNTLVLDLNSDENEQIWDIQKLSEDEIQVDRDGKSLVFKPFSLSGFTEKQLTFAEVGSRLDGKQMVIGYYFMNGHWDSWDLNVITSGTGSQTLPTFTFNANGTFQLVDKVLPFENFSFDIPNVKDTNLRTGTWTIDSDERLVLTHASGDVQTFFIEKLKNEVFDCYGKFDSDKDGKEDRVYWHMTTLKKMGNIWFGGL